MSSIIVSFDESNITDNTSKQHVYNYKTALLDNFRASNSYGIGELLFALDGNSILYMFNLHSTDTDGDAFVCQNGVSFVVETEVFKKLEVRIVGTNPCFLCGAPGVEVRGVDRVKDLPTSAVDTVKITFDVSDETVKNYSVSAVVSIVYCGEEFPVSTVSERSIHKCVECESVANFNVFERVLR